MTPAALLRGVGAVGVACLAAPVLAAGGHHTVDDAALAAPDTCDLESWAERGPGGARRLLHAGSACRMGAVELGLNIDRSRDRDAGPAHTTSAGLQLKWATPLTDEWSVGAVVSATWQRPGPAWAGGALLLPLTWQPTPLWALHANLGRDFRARAPDATRHGLAVEWTPLPSWQLLAERFHDGESPQRRFALRWLLSPSWSVDVGHARPLGAAAAGAWTLGFNGVLKR
jgi:hypothetical protein